MHLSATDLLDKLLLIWSGTSDPPAVSVVGIPSFVVGGGESDGRKYCREMVKDIRDGWIKKRC